VQNAFLQRINCDYLINQTEFYAPKGICMPTVAYQSLAHWSDRTVELILQSLYSCESYYIRIA